jgi:hypothetical protein
MSSPTEDFLIFLDEKKFSEKSSFFSKDFGSSAAAVIRSKIAKKVGSAIVMPVSDAKNSEIKRLLLPTSAARTNSIYRVHPLDRSRYILVNNFHENILTEKREEFCFLLKSVGGKYINWLKHPEWNKSYLSPDNSLTNYVSRGDELEKNFKFFKSSTTWQKVWK